jgi:hypothetical protein
MCALAISYLTLVRGNGCFNYHIPITDGVFSFLLHTHMSMKSRIHLQFAQKIHEHKR